MARSRCPASAIYMTIVGKHSPQYNRDFINLTQDQIAVLFYHGTTTFLLFFTV
jgi:hypothetical protein